MAPRHRDLTRRPQRIVGVGLALIGLADLCIPAALGCLAVYLSGLGCGP